MLKKEPYFEYEFFKDEVKVWLLSYNENEKCYISSKMHSISLELWNELENKLCPLMNKYPTCLKYHVIVGCYLYLLKRKDFSFEIKDLEKQNFTSRDLIIFSSYGKFFINNFINDRVVKE